MASSLSLREILDSNKLIDLNYMNWLRNLKIVLTQEKVFYILDVSEPQEIGNDVTEEEISTYRIWKNDSLTIKCIILASMSNKLWMQH